MKLIPAILLATTLAAQAWQGQIWETVAGPTISGTWGEWSRPQHKPIAKANAIEHKRYGNSAPTYRIITGTTQQVDEITGATNTVDVSEVVPYGVLRADGSITAPALAEWGLWPAYEAAVAQAEFEAEAQAFISQHQAQLIKFFAAVATFPSITLPTTYDEALNAMDTAIVAAEDANEWAAASQLNRKSRIAQDIYTRILVPDNWTGERLARLAAMMQGNQ